MTSEHRPGPRGVIIGFGVLGQYIVPCFERLLGDGLAEGLAAVKATPRGLDELRARFPFRIQAGGADALLEAMRPEIVVLAVKPPQVADVLADTLAPYLARRRAEGASLPDVYSFASTPRVERYREALGDDVNVVCMIPSMQREVAGFDTAAIGVSFMAFDPAGPWPDDARARARGFLGVTGCVLELPPGQMPLFIALNCACHVMYECCFMLSDALAARGREASLSRVAQTLRRAFRGTFDDPSAARVSCDGGDAAPEVRRAAQALVTAWHDGVMDYAREAGADPAQARRHIGGSMELFLIEAQLGTREALEENTRRHATPGGFTERAVRLFAADGAQACDRCIAAELDGEDLSGPASALRAAAARCARGTAGVAG